MTESMRVRDLFDLPDQVRKGDFVLQLSGPALATRERARDATGSSTGQAGMLGGETNVSHTHVPWDAIRMWTRSYAPTQYSAQYSWFNGNSAGVAQQR